MGSIVGRLADVAVVTNDNPRTEDPRSIADAIVDGMQKASAEVIVELDRSQAIDKVVQMASAGDVVLIAGKGHEPYQIIGEEMHHFDDRQEARAALWRRRRGMGEA
jgi:UDP-N-acetylmuramoyl-L-alanyl-D-glutamate--2,6-diaminopimelate ligase